MTYDINLDVHGQDLRHSCLADYIELQAVTSRASFTEAELADYIYNCNWQRYLIPRYIGDGLNYQRASDSQEASRDSAGRVFEILDQRAILLQHMYPFDTRHGRLVVKHGSGETYLWFLYISLSHGMHIPGLPDPAREFEKVVSVCLENAGIPAVTVGTSSGNSNLDLVVNQIGMRFPHLVQTIDDAVRSQFANDGGVDTFATLNCLADTRHGHWAFIGQSTVGKSDDWKKKINEPIPNFWKKAFGERIEPLAFFATPHHVQDDYMKKLFQDYERCLLDRIRLTIWSPQVPSSYPSFDSVMRGLRLQ